MCLFNKEKIIGQLPPKVSTQIAEIEIFQTIESTNQYLLDRTKLPSGSVCIAEQQTQGRGRQGRTWISPPTGNLYLSILWHFNNKQNLPWPCLSLICGLSIVRVLKQLIFQPIHIKWPNDILVEGKKISGILVESNLSDQYLTAVIGMGVNINLPIEYRRDLPYEITDLNSHLSKTIESNELVAKVLQEVIASLQLFAAQGFQPFRDEWLSYANYLNKPVSLVNGTHTYQGIMTGINEDGALLLEQNGIITPIYSGEFSLRPQR